MNISVVPILIESEMLANFNLVQMYSSSFSRSDILEELFEIDLKYSLSKQRSFASFL